MLKKITTSGGGKIITVKGEKMLSEEIYKVVSYHNIVKLFQAKVPWIKTIHKHL